MPRKAKPPEHPERLPVASMLRKARTDADLTQGKLAARLAGAGFNSLVSRVETTARHVEIHEIVAWLDACGQRFIYRNEPRAARYRSVRVDDMRLRLLERLESQPPEVVERLALIAAYLPHLDEVERSVVARDIEAWSGRHPDVRERLAIEDLPEEVLMVAEAEPPVYGRRTDR